MTSLVLAGIQQLTMDCENDHIAMAEALAAFEKELLIAALIRNKGNQCSVAAEMGVHRNTLGRKIAELKINWHEIRPRKKKAA